MVRDLFHDDALDIEGARRRSIVAAGGTCVCGARVVSWPWAARLAGMPEPKRRVVPHDDDCPALLDLVELEETDR